ncbi:MAG: hypothetical protein H0T68_13660 [Gemmatimonadales bacterium]|nr:hypothetical protein [Gemmatimonadales bacterium]
MNRFRYGMVPAFALLLVVGCSTEPTDDLREGVRLVAEPSQLFLQLGESNTVEVSAVDNQGNPLTFPFEVTDQQAGIEVRRDSTFLPIYVDDSTLSVPAEASRFRFIVTATGYTATSFTVTAGGEELPVPVQVVPQTALAATFSNPAPGLGETVTITAPPGTRFSATSIVRTADTTAAQPFVVGVSADGTTIDVILPPNLADAPLTITDVTTDAAPGLTFAPATSALINTPAVPNFTGTTSNLTPAVNEPVTVTVTGATLDTATNLILGAGAPTITNLTTNTVTFIPAPGAAGLLVINGVVLDALPQIPLSLPAAATDTISVSADIPTIAGTEDPSTAPTLITPSLDRSSVLFDKPAYDNAARIDAFYELVITEAGAYTITLDWDIGSDIDMFLCPEAGVATFDCDFSGATGAHPELVTFELAPGTYFVVAEDFGDGPGLPNAAGTTLQINVDHAAPTPPALRKALAPVARKVHK